jgi:DNA-binding MarR family transcriptional regulator
MKTQLAVPDKVCPDLSGIVVIRAVDTELRHTLVEHSAPRLPVVEPMILPLRLAVLHLCRRLRQQTVGNVTSSQHSALSSIAEVGELSLGDLAAVEQVAPPSISRITAALEQRGLVARRVDEVDRRVCRVAISRTGLDLLLDSRRSRDAYLPSGPHAVIHRRGAEPPGPGSAPT